MPTGRAALLLRRLSTGDTKLKSLNLNQNTTKEPILANPVCTHRDLNLSKRYKQLKCKYKKILIKFLFAIYITMRTSLIDLVFVYMILLVCILGAKRERRLT